MSEMSTEQKLQRLEQVVRDKDLRKDAENCDFIGILSCDKGINQRKYPRCKVCDLLNS
jgi:hypothetical protein